MSSEYESGNDALKRALRGKPLATEHDALNAVERAPHCYLCNGPHWPYANNPATGEPYHARSEGSSEDGRAVSVRALSYASRIREGHDHIWVQFGDVSRCPRCDLAADSEPSEHPQANWRTAAILADTGAPHAPDGQVYDDAPCSVCGSPDHIVCGRAVLDILQGMAQAGIDRADADIPDRADEGVSRPVALPPSDRLPVPGEDRAAVMGAYQRGYTDGHEAGRNAGRSYLYAMCAVGGALAYAVLSHVAGWTR